MSKDLLTTKNRLYENFKAHTIQYAIIHLTVKYNKTLIIFFAF